MTQDDSRHASIRPLLMQLSGGDSVGHQAGARRMSHFIVRVVAVIGDNTGRVMNKKSDASAIGAYLCMTAYVMRIAPIH